MFTSVMDTEVVFVTKGDNKCTILNHKSEMEKSKKILLSNVFKQPIEHSVKNDKGMTFYKSLEQLNEYLTDHELLEFEAEDLKL